MPSGLRLNLRLSLLAAAFFICRAAFASDYGDAIVVGGISDARNLVPILASDLSSADICSMIFNGLVKYDKDLNLTGDLAEGWEVKEDGLVIIFHLRKGVTWQDGKPFTASDVEFTYRKLIDPQVRTPYSGDFERVKSLEILDDYTVKVTYKEPFAPGLSSWGMFIMPKHILDGQDLNATDFSRSPVGTGPYRLKSWRSQEKIELESYRGYFEKRPHIDRYIYRVISDESTMFLEALTQGLDWTSITPLQYVRQTDTPYFKKYYRKFKLPAYIYTYLGYNLADPRFSDKRVRKAIDLAVDKEEIIRIILLGQGSICTGPFVPQSWAYNHGVKPHPFDPPAARRLLADAGWKDTDKDGWLDKDGRVFEFTVITNAGNEERLKTAEIIQRRLKDVGIRMKIKAVEWSVFLNEFIDKRNFEAVLLGWSLSRDPDNYDIWHSSKTRPGEFNFLGFRNKEADQLLEEGRRVFDQDRRRQIYHELHALIYEEEPCLFLYVPDSLSILHKRFQGIELAPAGISYNFIDWWVSKREQKYRIR